MSMFKSIYIYFFLFGTSARRSNEYLSTDEKIASRMRAIDHDHDRTWPTNLPAAVVAGRLAMAWLWPARFASRLWARSSRSSSNTTDSARRGRFLRAISVAHLVRLRSVRCASNLRRLLKQLRHSGQTPDAGAKYRISDRHLWTTRWWLKRALSETKTGCAPTHSAQTQALPQFVPCIKLGVTATSSHTDQVKWRSLKIFDHLASSFMASSHCNGATVG